jgi:antibiotic biosynthesis monooxygenase (ABM) superfamily enzyme
VVIVSKNNAQSHGLGHWLWLSGSPSQAKANSRPTLLAWLGLACVAWLGLAFGLKPFKPSHAHHYLDTYMLS